MYDIVYPLIRSFQQFQSASGRAVISDWRKRLSPARRAIFDMFLNRLAKMDRWDNGICKKLKGNQGCWELRWPAEKVEHRVFGYYGQLSTFVMVIACTHKGKVYDPTDAFGTLTERLKKIERREGEIVDYDEYRFKR